MKIRYMVGTALLPILMGGGCYNSNTTHDADVRAVENHKRVEPLPSLGENELSMVTLKLDSATITPSSIVKGEIIISLADGWHTYGDPPGDSGMAPIFSFNLPEKWAVQLLPFPTPKTFVDDAGGTIYGYEKQVAVPFMVTAPANAQLEKNVTVKLSAQWLLCNTICVPQSGEAHATLTISNRGN